MTPEQRQLVDELLDRALSLDADQRKEFLAAADIHEPCIRTELQALLIHHERAEQEGFLERSSASSTLSEFHSLSDTTPDLQSRPIDAVEGYEILGVLGRGGMGIVYQARQIRLNRVVALKMILDSQFATSKTRQRFLAEAEMIARVRHPNIVQIHEANTHKTGPFFSMEFVEGGSLAAKLKGKPLPLRQAAELVQTLAGAIDAAHRAGIIHRDLKPGNVLLTNDGIPKVMDFGVARQLSAGPGMTESGVILGTPSYMAPEQARGDSSAIGPACDIYALGAILYELLTGRPPFAAENSMETVLQVLNLEPVPPRQLSPKIPRDLQTICLKCLQKDPSRRYATAQDLADDLNRFLQFEPIRARPVGRWEIAWRYCQRNRIQTGLAASLILTLVGSVVVVNSNSREAWANEARKKVELLLEAETVRVPQIAEGMSKYRPLIDTLLRDEFTKAGDGSKEKLNLSLALLSPSFESKPHKQEDESKPHEQEELSRYLFKRILDAKVEDLRVIREALSEHSRYILQDLWETAKSPNAEPVSESRRLRAVSALASFARGDDTNWKDVEEKAAIDLLNVPKVHLYIWMELLRDIRAKLIEPQSVIFRDHRFSDSERLLAGEILAVFAEDDPKVFARLVVDADEKQFAVILPKLRDSKQVNELGLPELTGVLKESIEPTIPSSDESRESLAKRQVNAAVALFHMKKPDEVWKLLKFEPHINPDPRVRSYLIHELPKLGVDFEAILARLSVETDISARRAMVLCLGEFKGLPPKTIESALPLLQKFYLEPDAGLHAATEWLLRTWGKEDWLQQKNQEWAKDWEGQIKKLERIAQKVPNGEVFRQWFVNSQRQTFTVIYGPVTFEMGSPMEKAKRLPDEPPRHSVQIGRTFAIASKPVTVGDYNKFLAERYPHENGEPWTLLKLKRDKLLLENPENPAGYIGWVDAALYCNWLSKKEGLPKDQWCYEFDDEDNDLTVKPKHGYLSLEGYRLPTEAEAEFATSAGASTSRYFGETDELFTNYIWFEKNSLEPIFDTVISHPSGRKKPNDFGLFDMQGNVWTWCQQIYQNLEFADEVILDQEDQWVVPKKPAELTIVLRGGSSRERAKKIRSSARTIYGSHKDPAPLFGIRLARTMK